MINIVVTCWDALEYTKVTIESLFTTVNKPYYLTIVDNHSTDGTREYLDNLEIPNTCSGYHVIHNSKNLGTGRACNEGFERSIELGVEYTCFCNNDLYFQDSWLEILEKCIDQDENIGMVTPLRPSTRVMFDSKLSTASRLKQLSQYTNWKDEIEQYMSMPITQFDSFAQRIIGVNGGGMEYAKCPPDALSSCCLLVRNNVFAGDGYFADPCFSKYGGEDMDATWTTAQKGSSCVYCKDVYVHHFRGKSIGANNIKREKLIFEGNQLFYKKWKSVIKDLVGSLILRGVSVDECLSGDKGDEYWFLNRLNRDIKFWHDNHFDESAK